MSSMKVKEVVVTMGKAKASSSELETDGLGPCVGFLLTFEMDKINQGVLIHYSHSIRRKKTNCAIVGDMLQIINLIARQTSKHYPKENFFKDPSVVSNFHLFVAGGETTGSQWIHRSLAYLNSRSHIRIKNLCDNKLICYFYNQLIGHVTIVKFVFKMLPRKEEEQGDDANDEEDEEQGEDDDDDDEKESDHGDIGDEEDEEEGEDDDDEKESDHGDIDDEEHDERSKEDKYDGDNAETTTKDKEKNDYPSVLLFCSVVDKKVVVKVEWSKFGYTDNLATLEINLNHDHSGSRWVLNHANIQKFERLCDDNEPARQRLHEGIDLIPTGDPFVTTPYHDNRLPIAINGFGLTGRLVFRYAFAQGFRVVAINDPSLDINKIVDNLRNDPIHEKFDDDISYRDSKLIVNGQQVDVFIENELSKLPWDRLGVEYVVESTDRFTTIEKCQSHIEAGTKKVIIAGSLTDTPMFVFGINQDKYTGKETILSNGSCTINCLGLLAKVVHEKFGIVRASVMFKLGRDDLDERSNQVSSSECGNAQQMIVSSTDIAAESIGKILPDLNGKFTCTIDPVPSTSDVSVVTLIVQLEKKAIYEEICAAIKEAANGPFIGFLVYTDEKTVPTDFNAYTHLSIFDAKAGSSLNDNSVKLVSWCKNQYGYSYHLINLINYIDDMKYCTVNVKKY